MPKIPTFEARGDITTEAPTVRTGIQLSPYATPAAALIKPVTQIAEYYEREKLIADKAEADKQYLQLSTELDEIEANAGKLFNPTEAQNTFNTQARFLIKQKIDQTKNKRIKQMLSDTFDQDIIIRTNNVKKLARAELDKQEEYNYNTKYEINLSKYKLATTQEEKDFYKNQIFSSQESRSLYFNDSDLTKQKSIDIINKDFFDIDFDNLIQNKNFGSALKMVKDIENSKFLTADQRFKYLDTLEQEAEKYFKLENGKDAILNKRAWGFEQKDRDSFLQAVAETGEYNDGQLSELAIGNNATYDLHKNALAAGFSNAATTGNPNTVRAGYDLYRLYEGQQGLTYLKTGMKLTDEQLDFYATLDFMVDEMGMDIRSAMIDYELYYKNKNDPNIKSIQPDSTKIKDVAKNIANNLFTEDADNIDEIENLVRRYSSILLQIRPTDQDAIMKSVQNRIEKNFKVDGFGQLTAIKPFRIDTHDDSIKAYIKYLWDNDRINKDLNDFDDLIAVDVDPTSTTSLSGIRIINKTFPTMPVIFKPAEGDFDENEFEQGIFSQKQLEQIIYPFGKDERYEAFLERQKINKNKSKVLAQEIIATKTGIYVDVGE
jgi:hypothetical protein